MLNKRTLSWLGLVLLALGFAMIFMRVLEMRISGGDVYPHYSTQRHDPLGCSALLDSLNSLEGCSAEQNLTPLTTVRGLDGDTTLLLLGLPRESFAKLRAKDESPVIRAVEDMGARLVITLNPELVPEIFQKKDTEEEEDWLDRRKKARDEKRKAKEGKEGKEEKTKEDELSEKEKKLEKEADEKFGIKLGERIAVEIADLEDFERPENGWKTKRGETLNPKGVPKALPNWFSQYRLEADDKEWNKVALVDKAPVIIERPLGKGSIVIATDSYFASNEALHNGGSPEFLLWLTGGKKRIIFDETIHGSLDSGGAMKLIRTYRLHGFFFGMFIFVGLWAWRSASSLTPGDESIERGLIGGAAVSGEQNNTGLIRLLKRSIPGKKLISQCLDVWRKSQHSRINADQEKKISSILSAHEAQPRKYSIAETYQAISRVLKKH